MAEKRSTIEIIDEISGELLTTNDMATRMRFDLFLKGVIDVVEEDKEGLPDEILLERVKDTKGYKGRSLNSVINDEDTLAVIKLVKEKLPIDSK